MPERDWRLRLYDIIEAPTAVESYVAGQDFTSFLLVYLRQQLEEGPADDGTGV